MLKISGQSAKDTLSILKQGGITVKGKTVLFGNDVIATNLAGGKKTAALTMKLTAAASQTAVQTLLRSIAIKSTDKVEGIRTLQFQITNIAGKNTNQAPRQIQVGR